MPFPALDHEGARRTRRLLSAEGVLPVPAVQRLTRCDFPSLTKSPTRTAIGLTRRHLHHPLLLLVDTGYRDGHYLGPPPHGHIQHLGPGWEQAEATSAV